MLRWSAVCLSWLCLAAGSLEAQQDVDSAPQSLLSQQHNVRVEVVMGRLFVRTVHMGTKRRLDVNASDQPGVDESLSVMLGDPRVNLRYKFHNDQERLTLDVTDGFNFSLERHPAPGVTGWTVQYFQQHQGPIRLHLALDDAMKTIEADSIWQLILEHPQDAERHFLPLLTRLDPRLALSQSCDDVRQQLIQIVSQPTLPPRPELMKIVQQLNHKSFAKRRAATKQLHDFGQPIVGFLNDLDPKLLSAEQRRRIKQIQSRLVQPELDTSERVAARLVANPRVWCEILASRDVRTREIATRHLSYLYDRKIAFAPDASESIRAAQLKQLRTQLR